MTITRITLVVLSDSLFDAPSHWNHSPHREVGLRSSSKLISWGALLESLNINSPRVGTGVRRATKVDRWLFVMRILRITRDPHHLVICVWFLWRHGASSLRR
jgi:hypothetical protein